MSEAPHTEIDASWFAAQGADQDDENTAPPQNENTVAATPSRSTAKPELLIDPDAPFDSVPTQSLTDEEREAQERENSQQNYELLRQRILGAQTLYDCEQVLESIAAFVHMHMLTELKADMLLYQLRAYWPGGLARTHKPQVARLRSLLKAKIKAHNDELAREDKEEREQAEAERHRREQAAAAEKVAEPGALKLAGVKQQCTFYLDLGMTAWLQEIGGGNRTHGLERLVSAFQAQPRELAEQNSASVQTELKLAGARRAVMTMMDPAIAAWLTAHGKGNRSDGVERAVLRLIELEKETGERLHAGERGADWLE